MPLLITLVECLLIEALSPKAASHVAELSQQAINLWLWLDCSLSTFAPGGFIHRPSRRSLLFPFYYSSSYFLLFVCFICFLSFTNRTIRLFFTCILLDQRKSVHVPLVNSQSATIWQHHPFDNGESLLRYRLFFLLLMNWLQMMN